MGDSRRNEPTDQDLILIMKVAIATATARGANRFEADEVAQSTVVKLWLKWRHPHVARARARGEGRWIAYIRITARNLHVDRIRAHQRRMARQTRAAALREARPVGSTTGRRIPATPCVVESLAARAAIAEEIRRLPPRQRLIAEEIFLHELTVAEVAARYGIQTQSVRKHVRAARETLQSRLVEAEKQPL